MLENKNNINITFMQQQDKIILRKLGKKLKKLREEKKISLNSFAFENNITSATLSRIENGIVDPKFITLLKIATALNIPLYQILQELNFNYDLNKE
ncbi:MAG: helix-turn-helix transcriptional regulator [Candidatus Gastranaerophilales bacterium]|nr:helix-turn-helix transcriptional regulator [Candidatus Gastranaerophilales bacterium]